jgi:pSer/pThr/pTyr-binding forkhead associated (FHA) protein
MTDTRYLLENVNTKKQYELHGTLQVGRKVPADQLVIPDDAVSRHHATLAVVDGAVCIQDENSRNGTYVNAQKIATKITLSAGDRVKFGSNAENAEEFEILIERSDETKSAPNDGHTGVIPDDVRLRLERLQAALAHPAPPDIRQPSLVVIGRSGADRIIPLTVDNSKVQTWSIGRGSDCAIRFDARDVSEHHATIERNGAKWSLLNLFATNGAYVNGSMVARRFLESGDCIQLSTIDCMFYLPGKGGRTPQRGEKRLNRKTKILIVTLTISFLLTLLAAYVLHELLFASSP